MPVYLVTAVVRRCFYLLTIKKYKKMEYKIKKGDKFLCLEDYIMDDDRVAYTKGKVYKSELDNRITDNDNDISHGMQGEVDFFEYFKLLPSDTVS